MTYVPQLYEDTHSRSYSWVHLTPNLTLHFSYGTLVGVQLEYTTFINVHYYEYSSTTSSRHITNMPGQKEVISTQLFEELVALCLPGPPPQTRSWLLERLRREGPATPS